ncbi:DJ-1/PfpI family protein [Ascidiimonas sp. W6]|uniref:DJ-1/PfpI family protein n=1 Tax=Ascidiimonas meishanensis TaxID=3128903 RepID=UPI0030EE35C9
MKKKICIYLFNGFSDWEIAYLTPEIKKNETFELVYFSKDGKPIVSMGGLRISQDSSLAAINTDAIEMLILPGGLAWETNENDVIDAFIKNLFEKEKTIAAICAATAYLAKKGFLDTLKHTSNDLNYLKRIAPHYLGEQHYVNALAVTDENLITANGIAPIEFARDIFKKVKLDNENAIEKWFQLFKNGIWKE